MAELVEQYVSLPLGIVDAAVIAIAERLNLAEVATVDRKHFSIRTLAAASTASNAGVNLASRSRMRNLKPSASVFPARTGLRTGEGFVSGSVGAGRDYGGRPRVPRLWR